MSEKKNEIIDSSDFSIRWRPDFRYRSDKFIKVELNNFTSKEPTVTDQDAYRVTLASLRGEIAQGNGKIDVGSYSLKPGEEYNPNLDFSFLHRKDLTIVELDEHIELMKRQLEEADKALTDRVQAELAMAEKKREDLQKSQSDKNEEVK